MFIAVIQVSKTSCESSPNSLPDSAAADSNTLDNGINFLPPFRLFHVKS